MVKGDMKLLFVEILTELKQSWYKVTAKLLNAMYFGVPQARERMIFIGVREDLVLTPVHPKPFTIPMPIINILDGCEIEDKIYISLEKKFIWEKCKPGESFSKHHPKGHNFNSIKLNPLKPSPTVPKMCMTNGSSGLFHWSEPRILTIPELKRIASFPDSYIFKGTFKDKWARIGNSVPPLLMKSIAETIYNEILSKLD
jgi:DNA (cytosine-5)-methyltransferase 1